VEDRAVQLGVCLLVGVAAAAEDLWRRRISNRTVLAGFAGGLAAQVSAAGWLRGPLGWLGGAAAGFAVFLVFFLAGGMGGGDVKLMAALGSCLGPIQILWAALFTAMAGAVLACLYLAWGVIRRRWQQQGPGAGEEKLSIPYAPAILAGTLLSFAAS
jgi:Flp pilus assembly protein protease CpaA